MSEPGLYVVATPIGNLEDISPRALRILAEADLVAAEDTRRTRSLLERHGVKAKLQSLHEHNESKAVAGLLRLLEDGGMLALVSDAGTPLISDPGYRLVREAARRGLQVIAVPGPSAVTAALSIAGLPTDRFTFEGFLPSRGQARRKHLESLSGEARTLVFFESSHRIGDALEDMAAVFGAEREAVLCRELTKQFETVLRGSLAELGAQLGADKNQRKGEFVVLVSGHAGESEPAIGPALELARALLEFLPASQAARAAARITGVSRRDIYAALGA